MVEFSARRVVAIAAIAGALVGGAVAAIVATASASGNPGPTATSGGRSVATAPVVRTSLAVTVQIGGSIGYAGSYTVATPSGSSAEQVAQAEQVVTGDGLALSADEAAGTSANTADHQAINAAQNTVGRDEAALRADRAAAARSCAGTATSSPRAPRPRRRSPRTRHN